MKTNVQNSKIKTPNTSKGITLVALVITIIVLLILAGVAINMAINSDGLFSKANEAADKWNIAVKDEEQILADLMEELDKVNDKPATDVYVTLYDDGTLVFSNNNETIEGKTVSKSYGNVRDQIYTTEATAPWYADKASITQVTFANVVVPTSTSTWFYGCSEITTMDLSNLNTCQVTRMDEMFDGCSKLQSLDVSHFDTEKVTNMAFMFQDLTLTNLNISNFNTSKVTDMCGMFYGCTILETIDVSHFNTSNVTDMSYLFFDCINLTQINGLEKLDTSNVQSMRAMFRGCENLTSIDLRNFDTRNVIDMTSMFQACVKLTSLDLRNFDTNNVTIMSAMFGGIDRSGPMALTEIKFSEKFVTNRVTNMLEMFRLCANLTSLDLNGFDTTEVTDMSKMFIKCEKLTSLDLSTFNTNKVTTMANMFNGCAALEYIYVNEENWQYKDGVNKDGMFTNCGVTDVTTEKPVETPRATE